jgi:hypothetical protein
MSAMSSGESVNWFVWFLVMLVGMSPAIPTRTNCTTTITDTKTKTEFISFCQLNTIFKKLFKIIQNFCQKVDHTPTLL